MYNEVQVMNRLFAALSVALLVFMLVALVTGIPLMTSYSANANDAYASVRSIAANPGFSVLRSVHHWTSALIIVWAIITVFVGLFSSSFRPPSRRVWFCVVVLLLLGMGFQLTGHLLPWDQQAVRTTVIETSIAGNVPVIGSAQQQFLRGGANVGGNTLSLWYFAHIAIFAFLALVILILLGKRLRAVREIGPASLAAVGTGAVIVIFLTLFVAPPLGLAATQMDYTSFAAAPEWYVVPMHGLLSLSQSIGPSLGYIGTFVIPGLLVLFLLTLPWTGKRISAKTARGIGVLGVVGLVALIIYNGTTMAPITGNQIAAASSSGGKVELLDTSLIEKGKQLFAAQGCDGCHKIAGKGGDGGPDLTTESNRVIDLKWQMDHIRKPSAMTPGSTMPEYPNLSEQELRALGSYVNSKH